MHFALLLLLFCAPAEAGPWDICQKWFGRLVEQPLPAAEQELWQKTFGPGGTHPFVPGADVGELYAFAYAQLPEAIRNKLALLPVDPKEAHQKIAVWLKDPPPRSFLDHVIRQGVPPRQVIRRDLAPLWEKSVAVAHAHYHWDHEAGRVALPLLVKGGESFVVVAGVELEARAIVGGWLVKVPRERLGHSFENPVNLEKVAQMNGAGVRPPAQYEAVVGHDGKFYPHDGNHRLEMDTRDFIPVVIPAPPSTTNLRATFDLLGLPQPSVREIKAYTEGQISWEQMVPVSRRQEFVIPPQKPSFDAPL